MPELDLVEIYRAKHVPQALILQSNLEEAGIRSILENDVLDGAAGEIPLGWSTSPKVMVDKSNEMKAREIALKFDEDEIKASERSEKEEDAATCLECGKPLPPGASVCPACGWTYGVKEVDAVSAEDGNPGTIA